MYVTHFFLIHFLIHRKLEFISALKESKNKTILDIDQVTPSDISLSAVLISDESIKLKGRA